MAIDDIARAIITGTKVLPRHFLGLYSERFRLLSFGSVAVVSLCVNMITIKIRIS